MNTDAPSRTRTPVKRFYACRILNPLAKSGDPAAATVLVEAYSQGQAERWVSDNLRLVERATDRDIYEAGKRGDATFDATNTGDLLDQLASDDSDVVDAEFTPEHSRDLS
jgi:hypothetical protein